MTAHPGAAPGDAADVVNRTVRYTAWSVFARSPQAGAPVDTGAGADELRAWEAGLAEHDVIVRGWYDVSGVRAGTDVMSWIHAPSAEAIQAALRAFRRTRAGAGTTLVWSAFGTHRPAEFARDHAPSFMLGKPPLGWLCVYPFVRSYDWYLLPEAERGEMLREHGLAGRAFPAVQANTVSSFALNDWEWILALEADDLHELVDLMRALRATRARLHVREEIPFHTGRRVDADGVVAILA